MKKYIILIAVACLVIFGVTMFTQSANAEDTIECVPSDAYVETVIDTPASDEEVFDFFQRYTYNGPWDSNETSPEFPGENWQANVKGDPHGVGAAGAYFRSHGNSGKGEWFYLEAVNKIVHHDVVSHDVIHEAVVCDPTDDPTEDPEVACDYQGTQEEIDECFVYLPDSDLPNIRPIEERSTKKTAEPQVVLPNTGA